MLRRRIGVQLATLALSTAPALAHATTATQLVAGGNHACALSTLGGVECWGDSQYGQLGDGSFGAGHEAPAPVVGLASGVASLGAGAAHSCAITTSGGVKCWGANNQGQLGDGTMTNSAVPLDVTGLGSGVASVEGGHNHTCAVTAGGGVKCWGGNLFGELGDGTNTPSTAPVDVVGLASGVVAVSAGQQHACVLTTGGGVKCWGGNSRGQLGDGTNTSSTTPVDVVGLASGVTAIAAGQFHACAVTAAGGVKCWGSNDGGSLGDGTLNDRMTPVDVSGATSGVADLEGAAALCARTTDGRALCWGDARASASEAPFFHGMTSLARATRIVSGITTTGEIKSSKGGRFISGYGPLATLHWPFGCALGYGDADGDAICDSEDPCATLVVGQQFPRTGPGPKPSLVVRRINTETVAGNDVVTLRAQFDLPPTLSFGDLDPLAQGSTIDFVHPIGIPATVAFPAGAYGGAGTAGWQHIGAARDRWEYVDRTGGPNGTRLVTRLKATDLSAGAPGGRIDLVLTMKAAAVPLDGDDLPLQIAIVLGDAAAGAAGACGEGQLARYCRFAGNGSTLTCRTSIFDSYVFF